MNENPKLLKIADEATREICDLFVFPLMWGKRYKIVHPIVLKACLKVCQRVSELSKK